MTPCPACVASVPHNAHAAFFRALRDVPLHHVYCGEHLPPGHDCQQGCKCRACVKVCVCPCHLEPSGGIAQGVVYVGGDL